MIRLCAVAILANVALLPAVAADVTYSDRSSFLSSVGSSFTDTYEQNLGYNIGGSSYSNYTDQAMSAVVGQTRYQANTFIPNSNLVGDVLTPRPSGQAYCVGCNGGFKLIFDSTSFGSGGVFGVGLDILYNATFTPNQFHPYSATVEFGDSTTNIVPLSEVSDPLNPIFFGITSDKLVKSLIFQSPDSAYASFIIDNLTIAGKPAIAGGPTPGVPEPASWAMLVVGFGVVGGLARRRKAIRNHWSLSPNAR